MTSFIEWIKGAYNTVYDFFETNLLAFLIIASAVIIVLFYLITRIATSGNYYARLSKKFKRLNIVIRNCQLNGNREEFLKDFNKEVSKKNKAFSFAWNSYLLDEGQDASLIFKNTKFDKDKKGFFNFFLVFSWIVPLCLLAILVSFRKIDFTSTESIYIIALVPIFIIVLGILFNIIYVGTRNKQRRDMLTHLEFFTNNIDGAVQGFEKADFELCGIKREKPSENVAQYDYESEKGHDNLLGLVNENLAKSKTEKALSLARETEQKNIGVDLERKLSDEEKTIQLENETSIDEENSKILNNLKRLKNLEILIDDAQNLEHPFGDVDVEKKLENEKELVMAVESKKAELNSLKKGKTLKTNKKPQGKKAATKQATPKKKADSKTQSKTRTSTKQAITKAAAKNKKQPATATKKETKPAVKKPAQSKKTVANKTATKKQVEVKTVTSKTAKKPTPAKVKAVKPASSKPATAAKPATAKKQPAKAPVKETNTTSKPKATQAVKSKTTTKKPSGNKTKTTKK